MALLIFMIFQLLLQVKSQGLPKANLTIFTTGGENVRMVCGGHEKQKVSECMFYPAGQENFKQPSALCNLTLPTDELIKWSRDSESLHVNISCYYSVYGSGKNETSPHSDKVSLRVRGLTTMSITEDSPTTLSPHRTSDGGVFRNIQPRSHSRKPSNLSITPSTMNKTSLAATSSTKIITDPISTMLSLTTHSFTSPANGSLESSTLTETTEHASGSEIKNSNNKMFFFMAVVSTGGGIILTGIMAICLYGWTRRPKDERIWIEKKSKEQGVSLPIAGSDSSGEEDTAFYSTINFVQSPSQPPEGNREESNQTQVEMNPLYCTILTQSSISSDSKDVYSQLTVH